MANEVKVSVILDDNGTMRLTEKSAKKVSKALGETSKSAQSADRSIKGTAGIAPTATKNFAKMSQTVGGSLVPAYATLAANVFAATAAFNFLKSAGDLRLLEEGQIAYASNTGLALGTLTRNIQEATGSQLAFVEASQAAAIGTAAGINSQQLIKLGSVARDVSAILGRDLTDSFNRLVRGITKAEPELLDELGIILRLKDAQESYADSLGIVGRELTSYEKSQAVAVFVLDQVEDKFGAIAEGLEDNVNGYQKLGKSLSDLSDNFKRAIGFLEPVLSFFAQNPFATLLLAAPLVKSALSDITKGIGKYVDKLGEGLTEQEGRSSELIADLGKQKQAFLEATPSAAISKATQDIKSLGDEVKLTGNNLGKLANGATLSFEQLSKIQKDAIDGVGAFANASEKTRDRAISAIDQITRAQKVSDVSAIRSAKIKAKQLGIQFAIIRAKGVAAFTSIRIAAITTFSKIARGALKILPYVGTAFLILDLIPDNIKKSIGKSLGLLDDFSEDLEKRIADASQRQVDFAKLTAALTRTSGSSEALKTLSNTIVNIPLQDLKSNLSDVNKVLTSQVYAEKAAEVRELEAAYKGFLQQSSESFSGLIEFNEVRVELGKLKGELFELQKKAGVDIIIKDLMLLRDASIAAGLDSSSAFSAFNKILTKVLDEENFDPKALSAATKEIEKLNAVVNSSSELAKRTDESYKALAKTFTIKTGFSNTLEDINGEISNLQKIIKQLPAIPLGGLTEDDKRLLELIRKRKELLKLQNDELLVSNNLSKERSKSAKEISRLAGTSTFLVKQEKARAKVAEQQIKVTQARNALNVTDSELVKALGTSDQKAINAKKAQLQAQLDIEDSKLTELGIAKKLVDAAEAAANIQFAFAVSRKSFDKSRIAAETGLRTALSETAQLQLDIEASKQKEVEIQGKVGALQVKQSAEFTEQRQRQIELLNLDIGIETARQGQLKASKQISKELENREFKFKSKINAIDLKNADITRRATPLQKERANIQASIAKSLVEEQRITATISDLQKDLQTADSAQITSLNQQIQLESQKLILQKQQTTTQAELLNFSVQFGMELKNSLESNLQGTIASILKNEETSIKDAILNLGKGILENLADFMAKKLTEGIMNIFFKPEANKPLVLGGEAARKSIETGADALAEAGENAANSITNSVKGLEARIKINCCDKAPPPPPGPPPPEGIAPPPPPGGITPPLPPQGPPLPPPTGITPPPAPDVRPDVIADIDVAPPSLEQADATRNPFAKSITGLKNIFGGFKDGIGKLFSKEGGFLSGLGDIFSGGLEGFSGLFDGLGSALGGLFGGGGGGGGGGEGGGWISTLVGIGMSMFGGGGVQATAMGGIYRGGISAFAEGGIVTRPTMGLVGEGGQNEAVVPLPDGKAIPVNMNGTNNNNNVAVNLNMSTGQSETTGNSEQLAQFGNTIVDLVQREIADQTRPGGLLSR